MGKSYRVDLTGNTYGMLTVIGWDKERSYNQNHNYWFCYCSCNSENIVSINGKYMRNGDTQSCGCLAKNFNVYELFDNNTIVMWTTNTNEPFYIDKEDYDSIKDNAWRADVSGYIVAKIDSEVVRLHRLLLGLPTKEQGGIIGDHIDGDVTNNRKSNLRPATRQQNSWNQKTRNTNTSGIKGVKWSKSKSKWEVTLQGRYLGAYDDYSEAVSVRHYHESFVYGDFMR